ncbi:MAG: GlsB/YeaQ/YmgE family stress response membrane protein [Armatimonadota bacterium]
MLGFLLLLVVAAVAGACGELIAGGKVPGGMLGSMVAGLIGAWIGGMLVRVGPVLWGIQIIPAILGAAIFVLILRLLTSSRQRMT